MEVAITLLALTGLGLSVALALREERRQQEQLTHLANYAGVRGRSGHRSI